MSEEKFINPTARDSVRRAVRVYLAVLILAVLVQGLLHCLFADLRAGGVYWFNLDKERNLPTWFSGMLFFIFGGAAFVACYWESRINRRQTQVFKMPLLWLGVGLAGLGMSLDEITILHENMFWKEVRQATAEVDSTWRYLTQWQVLYAVPILLMAVYMLLFFSNRFNASRGAKAGAFAGLGCWLLAFFLEGLRLLFKEYGDAWYSAQVVAEEILEMTGALFLIASVVYYNIDIALDLSDERQKRLQLASRLLTPKAILPVGIMVGVMAVFTAVFLYVAKEHEKKGMKVPSLVRRALRDVDKQKDKPDDSPPVETVFARTGIWFDTISPAPLPDRSEIGSAMATLLTAAKAQQTPGALPTAVTEDKAPRLVFLSMTNGRQRAQPAIGAGKGLGAALLDAWGQLNARRPKKPIMLKLDIVDRVEAQVPVRNSMSLAKEPSLHGLAFAGKTGIAFLPEELYSLSLVDDEKLQTIAIRDVMNKRGRSRGLGFLDRRFRVRQFTTRSYACNGELLDLYRGHRMWSELKRSDVMAAARSAGRYLQVNVLADGRFVYKYLGEQHVRAREYNIVRHAGTILSMLDLYATTQDKRLLSAAERAADYLVDQMQAFGDNDSGMIALAYSGKIKLGGVALAAVALAKHIEVTGNDRYQPQLIGLGEYIRGSQRGNGSFIHQRRPSTGHELPFMSEYYPGEAILALMRIYGIDPQDKWLDVAEGSASFLITERDAGKATLELIHDHWLLYGINELYRQRPKPLYLEHARRITETIVHHQLVDSEFPDYNGCFNKRPQSTPTATRSEGLLAAYPLFRDHGLEAEADAMLPVIVRAVHFQMQNQFRPENAMYAQLPNRCLGGVRKHLESYSVRIDYVQHSLQAFLALHRLMEAQGIESLPVE